MKPTLRTLSLQELSVLIDWAAAEGWNPGLVDAAGFWDKITRRYTQPPFQAAERRPGLPGGSWPSGVTKVRFG